MIINIRQSPFNSKKYLVQERILGTVVATFSGFCIKITNLNPAETVLISPCSFDEFCSNVLSESSLAYATTPNGVTSFVSVDCYSDSAKFNYYFSRFYYKNPLPFDCITSVSTGSVGGVVASLSPFDSSRGTLSYNRYDLRYYELFDFELPDIELPDEDNCCSDKLDFSPIVKLLGGK